MTDDLTNRGPQDRRELSGNEIWEMEYEVAKLRRLYPKHSLVTIRDAIEWAFDKVPERDRRRIEGHVALYLGANPPKLG